MNFAINTITTPHTLKLPTAALSRLTIAAHDDSLLPEDERTQLNFDTFKISYVKPSVRKTFDSKKLQDEDIETYNKYLRETEVSATIKFI